MANDEKSGDEPPIKIVKSNINDILYETSNIISFSRPFPPSFYCSYLIKK